MLIGAGALYGTNTVNTNLAGSGIYLGQIRIPIWPSQIPGLAKFLFGLRHKHLCKI